MTKKEFHFTISGSNNTITRILRFLEQYARNAYNAPLISSINSGDEYKNCNNEFNKQLQLFIHSINTILSDAQSIKYIEIRPECEDKFYNIIYKKIDDMEDEYLISIRVLKGYMLGTFLDVIVRDRFLIIDLPTVQIQKSCIVNLYADTCNKEK